MKKKTKKVKMRVRNHKIHLQERKNKVKNQILHKRTLHLINLHKKIVEVKVLNNKMKNQIKSLMKINKINLSNKLIPKYLDQNNRMMNRKALRNLVKKKILKLIHKKTMIELIKYC